MKIFIELHSLYKEGFVTLKEDIKDISKKYILDKSAIYISKKKFNKLLEKYPILKRKMYRDLISLKEILSDKDFTYLIKSSKKLKETKSTLYGKKFYDIDYIDNLLKNNIIIDELSDYSKDFKPSSDNIININNKIFIDNYKKHYFILNDKFNDKFNEVYEKKEVEDLFIEKKNIETIINKNYNIEPTFL